MNERIWLLAAAAFSAAALALTLVVMAAPAPLPGDIAAASWVQHQVWFERIAGLANPLGGALASFVLGAAAVIVVISGRARGHDFRAALALLAFVLVLRLLSPVLKELVASPRPDASYGISVNEIRDTYGFPSGHVYSAVLVYGSAAWVLARSLRPSFGPAMWGTAGLIFAVEGPSRVFVGAHWPSDVLGGYLWGAAVLTGALGIGCRLVDRHRSFRSVIPPAAPGQSARDGL